MLLFLKFFKIFHGAHLTHFTQQGKIEKFLKNFSAWFYHHSLIRFYTKTITTTDAFIL